MHAVMQLKASSEVSGDEPCRTETVRARSASYPAPTSAIPISRPVPIPRT
jgi:hypothetical protein